MERLDTGDFVLVKLNRAEENALYRFACAVSTNESPDFDRAFALMIDIAQAERASMGIQNAEGGFTISFSKSIKVTPVLARERAEIEEA